MNWHSAALGIALLTGTARAESLVLSWRGCYVGTQIVGPLRGDAPTPDGVGLTALALIGLTEHATLNVQLIVPARTPDYPLYRIGVDWRLF